MDGYEGAYVAFITDVYSRRIAGWNVASTLRADILPLQALDMAAWQAGGDLAGLVHHADHGSNYLSLIYTARIAELGAQPSPAEANGETSHPALTRSACAAVIHHAKG